jgi:peptidoglycan/LPS O-acetylase OafA/YrhL
MKITYRPEIDGLRAIAVVAVILYHAQITILGQWGGGLLELIYFLSSLVI